MVMEDKPILLLLDSHQSHLSLAKENGVVLLPFPPHTTHKLKPLYRFIYGTLKKFVNSAPEA
jgi:hypothetical protein